MQSAQDAYGLVEVLSRLVKEPLAAAAAEASEEEFAILKEHVKKARSLADFMEDKKTNPAPDLSIFGPPGPRRAP